MKEAWAVIVLSNWLAQFLVGALIFDLKPTGGPVLMSNVVSSDEQEFFISFHRRGRLTPELYMGLELILRPEFKSTFEIFNYYGPKLGSPRSWFTPALLQLLVPLFWFRRDISSLQKGDIPLAPFENAKLKCESVSWDNHICSYPVRIRRSLLVADHRYFQYRVLLIAKGATPLIFLKGKSVEKIASTELTNLPDYQPNMCGLPIAITETRASVQITISPAEGFTMLQSRSSDISARSISVRLVNHSNFRPKQMTLIFGCEVPFLRELNKIACSKFFVQVVPCGDSTGQLEFSFTDPQMLPEFNKRHIFADRDNAEQRISQFRIVIPKSLDGRLIRIDSTEKAREYHACLPDDSDSKYSGENECPICLDQLNIAPDGNVIKPENCPHLFHRDCLDGVLDYRCPLCRKEL